jgi:hypothetical protein
MPKRSSKHTRRSGSKRCPRHTRKVCTPVAQRRKTRSDKGRSHGRRSNVSKSRSAKGRKQKGGNSDYPSEFLIVSFVQHLCKHKPEWYTNLIEMEWENEIIYVIEEHFDDYIRKDKAVNYPNRLNWEYIEDVFAKTDYVPSYDILCSYLDIIN